MWGFRLGEEDEATQPACPVAGESPLWLDWHHGTVISDWLSPAGSQSIGASSGTRLPDYHQSPALLDVNFLPVFFLLFKPSKHKSKICLEQNTCLMFCRAMQQRRWGGGVRHTELNRDPSWWVERHIMATTLPRSRCLVLGPRKLKSRTTRWEEALGKQRGRARERRIFMSLHRPFHGEGKNARGIR